MFNTLNAFITVFIFDLFFFGKGIRPIPVCPINDQVAFFNQFVKHFLNIGFRHSLDPELNVSHLTLAVVFQVLLNKRLQSVGLNGLKRWY
jgi:hypothetical protein